MYIGRREALGVGMEEKKRSKPLEIGNWNFFFSFITINTEALCNNLIAMYYIAI